MDAQEERKEEYSKSKEVKGKAEKKEEFAQDLQRTVHEECGSHQYRRPQQIVRPHLFSF
jgi:hypothetical protein